MKSFLPLFFCAWVASAEAPPAHVRIEHSEKMLVLTWDSVPGAKGYRVYDHAGDTLRRRVVNPQLITSGTRFAYVWDLENGERVKKIKGYDHRLSVAAVFESEGGISEGPLSSEADNHYFDGFANVLSRRSIERLFAPRQGEPFLPVERVINPKEKFIKFMDGPGRKLAGLYKTSVNPLSVGGCAPMSAVLVKLLGEWGLTAYRAEGQFIDEYHTFVVLNIEGVEYILDFTADQFVPGVIPVFFPRDFSHLSSLGRLSLLGKPIYKIEKLYTAGQSNLADNPSAAVYRDIFDKVLKSYLKLKPKT